MLALMFVAWALSTVGLVMALRSNKQVRPSCVPAARTYNKTLLHGLVSGS